ncbi:YcaO-like family protein [Haloarchaeobius baliensis]|uniref:YcaO-like family protein n=1 Tax=Haloarchaeobius baliensis TaxID=1670458 RepID=UPI003F8815FD
MEVQVHDTPIDASAGRLLGRRTGLVRSLHLMLQSRDEPQAMLCTPDTCDVGYLADADGQLDLSLGGKAETLDGSFMSALGETVERYCLCFPPALDDLTVASYDELAEERAVVDYDHLDIWGEAVYEQRLAPLSREVELPWTTGTNLLTGEPVAVPADLVWADVGSLGETPTRVLGTSNGCAAGPDRASALLGSLYELVERDAFMRSWGRQEPPTRYDADSIPAVSEFVAERLPRTLSAHVFAYDSPVDLPTVGAAIVNDRDERPKFLLGGATDVDPVAAICDSLVECIQSWPYAAELAIEYDVDDLDPADPEDNFDANVLHYTFPEQFDELSMLFEREPRTADAETFPDRADWSTQRALEHCLDALAAAGCTPIAFDLTTRDVAAAGLSVTRVVVPELVPLTLPFALPENHPAFDGDELTEKPHPFP